MRPRRVQERGQVAVYAIVLFPLLVLVLSLVYVVGQRGGPALEDPSLI